MLVAIALSGCFVKPDPPLGAACAQFGSWSAPMAVGGDFAAGISATSPWLSDDGTELWFASVPSSGSIQIWRATGGAGSFRNGGPVTALDDMSNNDNPNFAPDGQTLSFDRGVHTIMETRRPDGGTTFGALISHDELPGAIEPWIMPGGLRIYFAVSNGNGRDLWYADRTTVGGMFGAPTMVDAGGRNVKSPTIAPDGTTIYYTDQVGHTQIWTGQLQGDTLVGGALAFSFEMDGAIYFDPSISRDGKTLIYALQTAGDPIGLSYVTRDCL